MTDAAQRSPVVERFLDTARLARSAIGSPVHADRWREPSALAEDAASAGHDALVERLDEEIDRLTEALTCSIGGRRLTGRDGIVLSLEACLDRGLVEPVVHLDDLAVSFGDDGLGRIPDDSIEPVVAVLAVLASRRRGGSTVMRSLARRERNPAAVRAL